MKKLLLSNCILVIAFEINCRGNSQLETNQGNQANAGVFQPNQLTSAKVVLSATQGGYVNVGNMQLAVPAGTIAEDTEITAELTDIPAKVAGAKNLGKSIKFSPEGLQFLRPAELLFCYDAAAMTDVNENSTMIYYQDENNELVAIAGNVDTARHCVKSSIEHFSSYVAVAFGQVAGNTAPTIGGANFLPTTPFAGIPLRVRTQISDVNGGGVTGQIISAFLNYRTVGASAYTRVALTPDVTDDTVANRYAYLIPATDVTLAGIQYFFEATDNLSVTRTTAPVIRTVPSAATTLRFNPVTTPAAPLKIASGFTRALTLQAANNPAGPWQNISLENQAVAGASLGTAARSTPSALRFLAQGAGTGTITSTAGALIATLNVEVTGGLLSRIEITDVNQVALTGTYSIGINQMLDFDIVGFDSFGNSTAIFPTFTTTGGIGTVNIDATGAHFTAGTSATTGTLIATAGGLNDTLNFSIFVPPVVTATAPGDATTDLPYAGLTIGVTFSKIMDVTTLTTNTNTTCSGTIQVSIDNFATCVPMVSATPAFFSGNMLAIVTPTAPLASNSVYKIRVLASTKDIFGFPLPGVFTTSIGFTTIAPPPCATVVASDSLTMVCIPANTTGFSMGSTAVSSLGGPPVPVHTVASITAFAMAKYEVKFADWLIVKTYAAGHGYSFANAGVQGNTGGGTNQQPVTTVNARDMIIWCNAASQKDGLTPVYYTDAVFSTVLKTSTNTASINSTPGSEDNPFVNWSANGYRLPTEAEWEYAARYIDGTIFMRGDAPSGWQDNNPANGIVDPAEYDAVAWYATNSGGTTHAVGTALGNTLGLFDMSGNVHELVWDWYGTGTYTTTAPYTDPDSKGPAIGGPPVRVVRGGSVPFSSVVTLQSSARPGPFVAFAYGVYNHVGFRPVRRP